MKESAMRYYETPHRALLPVICVTLEARRAMDAYIRLCDDEISGLGWVSKKGNDFCVEKADLFKQEVTGASTELSSDALHTFAYEAAKAGRSLAKVKGWWHSHVDMDTEWSFQDWETIENLGKMGADWFVSIVGNKSGKYNARLDVFKPVRWSFLDLDLRVLIPEDKTLDGAISAEISEKVSYPSFFPKLRRQRDKEPATQDMAAVTPQC